MASNYIKPFQKTDYELLVSWWKSYNWNEYPPLDFLPDGYIAYRDNKPVAACFVYIFENAPGAFLTWLCTSRELNKDIKKEALTSVVNYTKELCFKKNKVVVFTYNNYDPLINLMENCGFEKTELNCTTMIATPSNIDLNFFKEDKLLGDK